MQSAKKSQIAANKLFNEPNKVYNALNSYWGYHAMFDGYGGYCFYK